MQTRTPNARPDSATRACTPGAIAANLLVVGTVCVLSAVPLLILASEPGRPAATVSRSASALVDAPTPFGDHSPGRSGPVLALRPWLGRLRPWGRGGSDEDAGR